MIIILKKFLYISLHGRVLLLICFFWVCQLRSSRKPSLKKLNKQLVLSTFIPLSSKCWVNDALLSTQISFSHMRCCFIYLFTFKRNKKNLLLRYASTTNPLNHKSATHLLADTLLHSATPLWHNCSATSSGIRLSCLSPSCSDCQNYCYGFSFTPNWSENFFK